MYKQKKKNMILNQSHLLYSGKTIKIKIYAKQLGIIHF